MIFSDSDTIAAIATAIGNSGISVIRISGEQAFEIVSKAFIRPKGKSFLAQPSGSIRYGHIINEKGELLDEVLVSKMASPHTYTTQDTAEINCHGGHTAAKSVLSLLFRLGARAAQPGEFTYRAFIFGRIDLSRAEAVGDVISSKTELALKAGVGSLAGALCDRINEIKSMLLKLSAELEVSIQYPEYDEAEFTAEQFREELTSIDFKLNELIKRSAASEMLREGLKIAICGKPNVGKSTLLNALINKEKAIVTDIPGTTRDVVDEYISLSGIPAIIMDTAGIRKSNDKVEAIGIDRSIKAAEEADVVLMVLDADKGINQEDIDIFKLIENKNHIIVVNKTDVGNIPALPDEFKSGEKVLISAKNKENLSELEELLVSAVSGIGDDPSSLILINSRHRALITSSQASIASALALLEDAMPVDLIATDISDCMEKLGMITGETTSEDVIDEIFSRFCLGK